MKFYSTNQGGPMVGREENRALGSVGVRSRSGFGNF